jgi:radial spoke head protein 1
VGERLTDGTPDGFGMEVLHNRDQYEGEYRRGLRNGRGCYMFTNGAHYFGEWKKSLRDGGGKMNYPDGSEYCGAWRRNKKHGFGKYTYRNGDVYEGGWRENVKNGLGTYTFRATPMSLRGTWIDGELRGSIVIRYPDYEYHGYFNGTNPVGEGAFTFGMQYMLPGHIEMYQHEEKQQQREIERDEPSEESQKSSSIASHDEHPATVESPPKCLPRFIAHEIAPYDYARLPQQPLPPPQVDSSPSACTQNSSSCDEVELFELQSPVLVSGEPLICCEGDEFYISESDGSP